MPYAKVTSNQVARSPNPKGRCVSISTSLLFLLLGEAVMLIDVGSLPGVADPLVAAGFSSQVAALYNILGKLTLLVLVLVVEHKDAEACLLALPAELLLSLNDILLELLDGILEGRPGVVYLVNNENVLADEIGHLERGKVEPLCAGDLGAGLLLVDIGAEGLIQGETNGLNRNVR